MNSTAGNYTGSIAELPKVLGELANSSYIVGGTVRDLLLERDTNTDLDIVITGIKPEDRQNIARAIADQTGGTPVSLHPETGSFRIAASTFHLDVSFCSGPIEDDLSRRDFTINAMAVPLINWEDSIRTLTVKAPHGGHLDLHNRKLKAINPWVFEADPVRMLRAVRLSAHLDLHIDEDTARLITENAHLLPLAPRERITDEMLKILAAPDPAHALQSAHRMGLLEQLIPGTPPAESDHWQGLLATMGAIDRVTTPSTDEAADEAFGHAIAALPKGHFDLTMQSQHSRRTVLKLATLLQGASGDGKTRLIPKTLLLNNRSARLVTRVAEQRHLAQDITTSPDRENLRRIYRFFRHAGEAVPEILFLTLAERAEEARYGECAEMVAHTLEQGLDQGVSPRADDRLVNGRDLTQYLGKPPGKWLTPMLERINEARAVGEISTRQEALQLAESMENTASG